MYLNDIYTTSVNLAGLPGISVPVARSADGLPIGVQLMARPFEEATLLRGAYVPRAGRLTPWSPPCPPPPSASPC